ncbi:DUF6973 domain-containing protein [Amycolatopsis aidingensis]|uniref:DUF6973 domain-containing protein n=1 Tax=Amycolatopsis aidingensis TaxID=2842453 RepID=UPI001C0B6011|nr:hypothetical protein [Amycolatopsis aidingensis]
MAGWDEIKRWNPDAVGKVGDALVTARNQVLGLQDEIDSAATPPEWNGPGAESAREALTRHRQDLETMAAEISAMTTVIDPVEHAVRQLKGDIEEAEGLADAYQFRIDNGTVVDRAAQDDRPDDDGFFTRIAVHAELVGKVTAVLQTAAEIDNDLQAVLNRILDDRITDAGATTLVEAAAAGQDRVDLDRILGDYQVEPDPDGTVTYPPIVGQTVTKREAELLDELGVLGMKDMYDIRNDAFGTAEDRFPGQDSNDSHQDAFRHAYWNALMTRQFGADWTEQYATAHEALPGNPADREAMDLYNNEVGRRIASENPDASPEELADLVAHAVREGNTVVIDGNGELAYSDDVVEGDTGRADDPAPEEPGAPPGSDSGSTGSGHGSGDYEPGSGPGGS